MKQKLLLLLLLVPFLAQSQTNDRLIASDSLHYKKDLNKQDRDSLLYYQKELHRLWKQNSDSFYHSEPYSSTNEKYQMLKKKLYKDSYSGMVIYADLAHTNYDAFNKSITASGFSPMNDMSFRVGFGITTQNPTAIFDFYFLTGGINNKSTRGSQAIKASFSNFFQFDVGPNVFYSQAINIYPYAGLSLRLSELDYSDSVITNNSYTNISNIISNNKSVMSTSIRLGYQLGLGVDLKISGDKEHTRKTVLFIKGGLNAPVWADKYKINGVTYNPQINHGDWLITVGFKFLSTH